MTTELEQSWSDYSNIEHSLFVNSCTSALHLSLEVLKLTYDWPDDSEVIVPALTFVSTAHTVLHANLRLRLADVDENSGNLNPSSLQSLYNPKTKCVIFVGLGGNLHNLEETIAFCKAKNISLIIDAAHLAGSRLSFNLIPKYLKNSPFNAADFTCFSFQAVKNLPTADAGMLCSPQKELLETARRLSWLGIDKDTFSRSNQKGTYKWEYDIAELGYKYNGNSIMAAIALSGLPHLDKNNSYRRTIFSWYESALAELPCRLISHYNKDDTSQHLVQIQVNSRDEVMTALNSRDIFPGVHYKSLKNFSFYRSHHDQTPDADHLSNRLISLPCHLQMQYTDVLEISESLTSILLRD